LRAGSVKGVHPILPMVVETNSRRKGHVFTPRFTSSKISKTSGVIGWRESKSNPKLASISARVSSADSILTE
jgi:hypothetical protein